MVGLVPGLSFTQLLIVVAVLAIVITMVRIAFPVCDAQCIQQASKLEAANPFSNPENLQGKEEFNNGHKGGCDSCTSEDFISVEFFFVHCTPALQLERRYYPPTPGLANISSGVGCVGAGGLVFKPVIGADGSLRFTPSSGGVDTCIRSLTGSSGGNNSGSKGSGSSGGGGSTDSSSPTGGGGPNSKEIEKALKAAEKTIIDAANGTVRRAGNYHGRLPANVEQDILSNPDRVYLSQGKSGRLIFLKGENVVITNGVGSGRGTLVTSYGPAGPRGTSGAAIFGGMPSVPGLPVTDAMIQGGTVPRPDAASDSWVSN